MSSPTDLESGHSLQEATLLAKAVLVMAQKVVTAPFDTMALRELLTSCSRP